MASEKKCRRRRFSFIPRPNCFYAEVERFSRTLSGARLGPSASKCSWYHLNGVGINLEQSKLVLFRRCRRSVPSLNSTIIRCYSARLRILETLIAILFLTFAGGGYCCTRKVPFAVAFCCDLLWFPRSRVCVCVVAIVSRAF